MLEPTALLVVGGEDDGLLVVEMAAHPLITDAADRHERPRHPGDLEHARQRHAVPIELQVDLSLIGELRPVPQQNICPRFDPLDSEMNPA